MKQKVLITGGAGFIGEHLLKYLKNDYEIICIIKNTEKNRQNAKKYKNIKIYWGNLLNFYDVESAVSGCDAIVHLAFSNLAEYEKDSKNASQKDIRICKNLLKAIKKQKKDVKLIFASSVAAYFYEILRNNRNSLKFLGYPEYAKNKLRCENLIRKSHLRHCILRIGAVLPEKITTKYFLSLPNINPETKMEFICINDLIIAICNAIKIKNYNGILLIGGGKKFQMHYGEFISSLRSALKIELHKKVQHNKEYLSDWFDTKKSQRYLRYQNHTFKEYLKAAIKKK